MRVRRHHESPVLVVAADIIQEQGLRMMEQEHAAQHVAMAHIPDTLWMASLISHRQPKVVVAITYILRHTRLRARKHKDARFPVETNLIVEKRRSGFRPINHYSGQDALHSPALRNRAHRV